MQLKGLLMAALLAPIPPLWAADSIEVQVPVALQQAKVVFNLDHLAFEGDEPTGMAFMRVMLDKFHRDGTAAQIVAIFHGSAGYMLLNDEAYNRVRNWQHGNPYKDQIAQLKAAGVEIEECGQTMRDKGWVNADLLPEAKVNSGANFRIIELVQQGYVQIQP